MTDRYRILWQPVIGTVLASTYWSKSPVKCSDIVTKLLFVTLCQSAHLQYSTVNDYSSYKKYIIIFYFSSSLHTCVVTLFRVQLYHYSDSITSNPIYLSVDWKSRRQVTDYLQSPPSPWMPIFGGNNFIICGRPKLLCDCTARNWLKNLNIQSGANLPPNIGIQGDGGLCRHIVTLGEVIFSRVFD